MRRFLPGAVLALALALPAAADTKDEVTAVIQSQIEAFLADDFATRLQPSPRRASRGCSARPTGSGQMVREGLSDGLAARRGAVNLDLRTEGGYPAQRVLITDENGASHPSGIPDAPLRRWLADRRRAHSGSGRRRGPEIGA